MLPINWLGVRSWHGGPLPSPWHIRDGETESQPCWGRRSLLCVCSCSEAAGRLGREGFSLIPFFPHRARAWLDPTPQGSISKAFQEFASECTALAAAGGNPWRCFRTWSGALFIENRLFLPYSRTVWSLLQLHYFSLTTTSIIPFPLPAVLLADSSPSEKCRWFLYSTAYFLPHPRAG